MDNPAEKPQLPLRMTLEPPIRCGGQEFRELIFDFESLSETEFARARLTFARLFKPTRNKMSASVAGDLYFCCIIAEAANDGKGVPVGLIRKLPRRYYNALHEALMKVSGKAIDAYLTKLQRR